MKIKISKAFGILLAVVLWGCTSQEMADAAFTAKVKSSLLVLADTRALKIGVQTTAGVVTLSGAVVTLTAKTRNGEVIAQTDYIKPVVHGITIHRQATGASNADEKIGKTLEQIAETTTSLVQPAAPVSDHKLLNQIKAQLVAAGGIGTEVEVDGSQDILKGKVPSNKEINEAKFFAKSIEGVKSVRYLLGIQHK